jgi:hypothetical protein
MNRAGDFLAWVSGADLRVLRETPRDWAKFTQLGSVLLAAATLAALSMIFLIHNGLAAPIWVAVLGGAFWGLIILSLDRFLVVSMGATRSRARLLALAAPRVLMSAVIAVVIAMPFTLEIFRGDIDEQITVMQLRASQSLATQEQGSAIQVQANKVQAQITADEAILAGNLPTPITSPQLKTAQSQVNTLKPQVTAAQQQVATSHKAYICALYGGASCPARGVDAGGTDSLKQTYDTAQTNYNSLNTQLTQAESNLSVAQDSVSKQEATLLASDQQAARSELPGLRSTLADLQQEIQQQDQSVYSSVRANNGILAQLTALFQASSENRVLGTAVALISLLFFLIGLLPVLVKLLLNLGPPSTYEQIVKAEDDLLADRLKIDRVMKRRQMEREAEEAAFADARPGRPRRWDTDDSPRYVRDKMADILDLAFEQWNSQVRTVLGTESGFGLQVEEIVHPEGVLQRFEFGPDEFLLVDQMGGRPTLNWTTSMSPRNFAALVAEYIEDDPDDARMAIGVGEEVKEASAETGIDVARSSGPSFDLNCTFLRCDTPYLDLAYQVLPGPSDAEKTRILGVSATTIALGQVLPLLVRTGTSQISAQALNVRPDSLPELLSSALVRQNAGRRLALPHHNESRDARVNLGIGTPDTTEASNEP